MEDEDQDKDEDEDDDDNDNDNDNDDEEGHYWIKMSVHILVTANIKYIANKNEVWPTKHWLVLSSSFSCLC